MKLPSYKEQVHIVRNRTLCELNANTMSESEVKRMIPNFLDQLNMTQSFVEVVVDTMKTDKGWIYGSTLKIVFKIQFKKDEEDFVDFAQPKFTITPKFARKITDEVRKFFNDEAVFNTQKTEFTITKEL